MLFELQARMPIKWMAPESLTDRILSTESDVWSYGILLWEIFSLGKVPYPGIISFTLFSAYNKLDPSSLQPSGVDTTELIQKLEDGYRMEKPNYAPNFIGEVMSKCWKKEPKERPSFSELEGIIRDQMESTVSSYYSNLDTPYQKFNHEKGVAPKTERFGLAKIIKENPKLMKSLSLVRYDVGLRYNKWPERLKLGAIRTVNSRVCRDSPLNVI